MKRIQILVASLLTVLLISSCKKSSDEANGPKASKEFYIQAKIDTKDYLVQADKVGLDGYASGVAYMSHSSDGATELVIEQSFISKYTSDLNKLTINVVKVIPQRTYDNEAQWLQIMYGLFKTSEYTFGRTPQEEDEEKDKYVEGVVISYIDADGKFWSTDMGSADQAGSMFKITSVTKNTDPQTSPFSKQIITAEFSCKLYDKSGNSKVVSNGKARVRALTHTDFEAGE